MRRVHLTQIDQMQIFLCLGQRADSEHKLRRGTGLRLNALFLVFAQVILAETLAGRVISVLDGDTLESTTINYIRHSWCGPPF